jgi:MATE family multidrug resistance protein
MLTTIRTALAGAWGAELRSTARLSAPIILTNFAQIVITTTDVVMMGWLSPRALAAGTLAVNLYYAVFVIGLGIAMAVAPMLAHELGRNRFAVRELRRTARQGPWSTTLVALSSWLVLWNTEPLLLAMGQDPALAADAGTYMRWMQWGLLPYLWFFTLRSFIAATERPVAGMVVTAAAIVLNALLCWAFMFGRLGAPDLGLAGAGLASSIASSFMVAALVGFIGWDRRFRRYRLLGRFWRADWPRFAEVWRIGTPTALALLFEVGVFNVAVFVIGLINTDQLAADAIAF